MLSLNIANMFGTFMLCILMFTCWVSGSSQLRALLSSSGRSASPAPRAGAGTPPPDTANTRGHNGDTGHVICTYTGNTCICLSWRLEKCKAYYVHVAFVCCWDNYVEDWAHNNGSVPSLEHSRNKQKETENGFGAKLKQMHKQGDYSQIGLSRTKLYIEH